jgi:hypothetical protein
MPATATKPKIESLQLVAPLDIQAAGDKKGPPTFSLVAYSGEPMKVAGFIDPVIIDLQGATFDRNVTPVIQDHDTTKRIGHTTAQRIDQSGIHASGLVSSTSPEAQSFTQDAKNGFPFQVSVGAAVKDLSFVADGQTATINGKSYEGPLIVATKTVIRELSVTVLGADNQTSAIVASVSNTTNKNHEPRKGWTMPSLLNRLFNKGNANEGSDIEAAAITGERNRVTQINAMLKPAAGESWNHVQGEVEQLRASAIAGDVSLQDLPAYVAEVNQLQAMRAERPTLGGTAGYSGNGPAIHARHRSGNMDLALEAAVAMHAGLREPNKHYDEQTIEAANRLGVTCLMDAARLAVQATGQHVDFRNKDTVLKAAFSTASLAGVLSNVAHKSLLEAYNAFPSAARRIAKRLTADNFKEHTGYRMTGDVKFQKVAGDGQIKHGTLADASYPYRIYTYAKMFGLDRQTIINDDLNALNEVPRMLGRGSALAIEEEFWTLVLANTGSFFSVGNKNLISGGGSVLAAAGLGSAVQIFLEQKDQDGKPIGVVPRFLCVPPALKVTGDELYTTRTYNVGGGSTTASDRVTTANSFYGLYEPVVAPWIGANGGLTGVSDTHWYLFGDPLPMLAGLID